MHERLFFLHIPKAAGTSFKEVLYAQYPFKDIAWIDGSYHEESVRTLKRLSDKRRKRYRCVMGHYQYGLHRYFEGNYKYVSFMRNPVKRVVSLYFHILRNSTHHVLHDVLKERKVSLEEFVTKPYSPHATNMQTAWLSGDDVANKTSLEKAKANIENTFACIGLSEAFDKSIIMMHHILGFEGLPHYYKKNIGKYASEEVTKKELSVIAEHNAIDIKLYDWIEKRFQKEYSRNEVYFNQQLKHFYASNNAYNAKRNRYAVILNVVEAIKWKYRHKHNPLFMREQRR